MDTKHDIEALEKSLERHLGWIKQADTKAQMLIAINLVLISAVVGQCPKPEKFTFLVGVFIVLGVALPFWNLYQCFASMSPYIKGPEESLTFFGKIACLTEEEYREKLKNRTNEDYMEDLVKQTHANALIATLKYRRIGRATTSTFVAIPLLLLAVASLFFKWYEIIRH